MESERFGQLLREKIDELDAAANEEAGLQSDEVELLRLNAAMIATRGEPRPWVAGSPFKYQPDQIGPPEAAPRLDLRFPVRPGTRNVPEPGKKRGMQARRK